MYGNDELFRVIEQGDGLPVGCLPEFARDDLFGVGPVVVGVVFSELWGGGRVGGWVGERRKESDEYE